MIIILISNKNFADIKKHLNSHSVEIYDDDMLEDFENRYRKLKHEVVNRQMREEYDREAQRIAKRKK